MERVEEFGAVSAAHRGLVANAAKILRFTRADAVPTVVAAEEVQRTNELTALLVVAATHRTRHATVARLWRTADALKLHGADHRERAIITRGLAQTLEVVSDDKDEEVPASHRRGKDRAARVLSTGRETIRTDRSETRELCVLIKLGCDREIHRVRPCANRVSGAIVPARPCGLRLTADRHKRRNASTNRNDVGADRAYRDERYLDRTCGWILKIIRRRKDDRNRRVIAATRAPLQTKRCGRTIRHRRRHTTRGEYARIHDLQHDRLIRLWSGEVERAIERFRLRHKDRAVLRAIGACRRLIREQPRGDQSSIKKVETIEVTFWSIERYPRRHEATHHNELARVVANHADGRRNRRVRSFAVLTSTTCRFWCPTHLTVTQRDAYAVAKLRMCAVRQDDLKRVPTTCVEHRANNILPRCHEGIDRAVVVRIVLLEPDPRRASKAAKDVRPKRRDHRSCRRRKLRVFLRTQRAFKRQISVFIDEARFVGGAIEVESESDSKRSA